MPTSNTWASAISSTEFKPPIRFTVSVPNRKDGKNIASGFIGFIDKEKRPNDDILISRAFSDEGLKWYFVVSEKSGKRHFYYKLNGKEVFTQ